MKRKARKKPTGTSHRATPVFHQKGKGIVSTIEDVIYANKAAQNDTTLQYMVDMFCIVLNDPEVMGKDTFGKERIRKVVLAVSREYSKHRFVFVENDEQGYHQAVLDRRLQKIFGDELEPFDVRYDWVKKPGI